MHYFKKLKKIKKNHKKIIRLGTCGFSKPGIWVWQTRYLGLAT